MRSARLTAASAALALSTSVVVPVSGQQPTFTDAVTVTATGSERRADDVPLPVTIVDRRQIDDAQEESVADLLRLVPGLLLLRAGDEGASASLFTRGTESDHTLAMFDGVRLSSPYFGGYDWSLLPTAGLDRVEVARGPFSALWGADALGGVVNVVPSRAVGGWSAGLLGEGGDDGWRRAEGSLGWADGGFDVFASGLDRAGEGELENSDFATRQALVDAGWSWGAGGRVAVLVQDLTSELGIPFSDPSRATPNRRQRTEQRLVAAPLRARLASGWDVEVVASQVERDLSFRDPDDPYGFTAADTAADTTQLRLASRHRFGAHDLSWGGEWREDVVRDVSSYGTNLDGAAATVRSAFVQEVWQPGDALQVIAGVRWDDAAEWGAELSPRLSVGWLVGGGVALRAGYGRAFRQPSVGELYFPFSGNPGLEPERSASVEAGATWTVGAARLQVSAFSTRLDNLIEFDYPSFTFANVASAEMRGVEAAWDAPLGRGLHATAQATWLDTAGADGLPLLRRAEWSAAGSLHGRLVGRLRGTLSAIWVGDRADVDAVTFARTTLGGHLTGDLSLAYPLLDKVELLLRVRNVADRAYEEIDGYPAPGRRVTGGLRWRL